MTLSAGAQADPQVPLTDRFSRQSALVPRSKLQTQLVTVIGVGAIGRQVALQLAALGASRLQLIDFDWVESTNVTTQGYLASDVGVAKVQATRTAIEQIDSTIQVEAINDRFRRRQSTGQIVFCCVDSIATRATIWRSLRDRAELFIDGRMLGEVIRVLTVAGLAASGPSDAKHYDATLFSPAEAQQGACTSHGTIYTASIAAGLMVQQLTRWLRDLPIDRDLVCNLLASELVVH